MKITKKIATKKAVSKKAVATKKVAKKATSKKVAKKVVKKTQKPVKKVAKKAATKAVKKTASTAKRVVKKKLTKSERLLEVKSAELMQLGKERGYVTYDELLRAFPEIEKDVDYLDTLYERFSIAGIDVLQSGGMLGDDPSADVIAQKNAFKRGDGGYDSIQMYLREI
ncbi:RNA polymerase sigma factor region1.1 domain-containing protein, partial [Candidatus Kaiserbacteria bacterium]|nr:RNA polymerase sigma factor region1.1 domain-containing protein [Candidatus Kaiserbacteria bacterium]